MDGRVADRLVDPTAIGLDADLPERLRERAELQVGQGFAKGMQLFVARDGCVVVDESIGTRVDDDVPITPDTRLPLFSASKAVTAAAVHVMEERGELSYADPIARHVPEFGTLGKEHITVHHAFCYQAGIPDFWMRSLPIERFTDWDGAIATICELPLEHWPGTQTAYHPLTAFAILAEVVRRTDGRTFDRFCAEEIFLPLRMDRTTWGLSDELLDESTPVRATAAEMADFTDRFMAPAVRRSIIPGAGLWSTARDLGRFYMTMCAGGELDGVRLLSPATVALATSPLVPIVGRGLGVAVGYGFGVGVAHGGYSIRGQLGSERIFGIDGLTVASAWCDPETKLVGVFLSNLVLDMAGSDRRFSILADTVHRAVLER